MIKSDLKYCKSNIASHGLRKVLATITRCDLLPRFLCVDATLLWEFESDKIWINEFERIVADKSHRVIAAFKPGFHLDFFAFCCSFWFFVPTETQNEQCDAQMETSTKNQNEQPAFTCFGFEIQSVLSQKQERATKSS